MVRSDAKLKGDTAQTRNWYKDRYETVITQRNFLATIALVSLTLALIAGVVILMLVPSKTVMPFLIQVDEKSGVTQVIDPESQGKIIADEALRKYFVVKFLSARESYDSADIDLNMNTVRLLAARDVYKKYWNEVVNQGNKESLYIRLASEKIRQVQIKAVQFLDANRAHIRFSVVQSHKFTDKPEKPRHFIALVTFRFENIDLTLDELLVNPLGFRVTEYKVDEDASL